MTLTTTFTSLALASHRSHLLPTQQATLSYTFRPTRTSKRHTNIANNGVYVQPDGTVYHQYAATPTEAVAALSIDNLTVDEPARTRACPIDPNDVGQIPATPQSFENVA